MKNNNPFVAGIPDCWYSGIRADLWVEFKFAPELPVRETTLVVPDLSALQRRWIASRLEEGRNVALIHGSPKGGVFYEKFSEMLTGIPALEFSERMATRKELAQRIFRYCHKET